MKVHHPAPALSIIIFLTLSLLTTPNGVAQSGRGTIAGTVRDSAGAVLQGARVELEPRAAVATSSGQGDFTVTDLTPGSYSVKVSYIGFSTLTSTVKVTAGQVARVDAVLKVASETEQITVTAERVHGEVEAINREIASDNILQVLPVEVITSLPNTNIADALGRLPSVTLDATRARANTFRFAALSQPGATSPSTAWKCLPRKAACVRSSSTRFRQTWWNRSRLTRLYLPTRMAMPSAAPSTWSPRLLTTGQPFM